MRRRPGAVLSAVTAALVLAVLSSGCATTTTAGEPSFGAPKASATPAPTGLAAKPLDEIFAAVQKFASKQKSVHINVQIDGKPFSDADVSYTGAEGSTYVDEKKVQFRTVGDKTYVQKSGDWSEADGDLGDTIQQRTNFQDIVEEIYSLKKQIKDSEPKTAGLFVLTDGKGTEIDVANDEDSAALQAFHIKTGSETDELLLSEWSEESLQLEAPPVS